MKTIAVISKNSVNFEDIGNYASVLLYKSYDVIERHNIKRDIDKYIWSVVEPYIQFVQVDENQDSMLESITNHLTKEFPDKKADVDFFYHTEASYSFPKRYLEMVYCQPLWKDYPESDPANMNHLACLSSLKHTVIENSAVIIGNSYDLESEKHVKLDSVTKEDICKIIRRRFYFSAVLIKDNNLVKYYYQNPGYLVSSIYGLEPNDKIEKLSISHLGYNLTFYFQYSKSKYTNKIATRINGMYQLHGDVLLLHEIEENVYANLSIHEAKRLNVLSYGRLYDRQPNDNENHQFDAIDVDKDGKETTKKVTPLWSRYVIIENRMKKWSTREKKCINCDTTLIKPITCDKCFRIQYCSLKCQSEYSTYHNDDCINPKSLVL